MSQNGPSSRPGSLAVRLLMLDDSVNTFYVPYKSTGKDLYAEVVKHLQVIESDYFDLEFSDAHGVQCWLNHEKLILRQVSSANQLFFKFSVKFYTPDPSVLEDEYTRYLYALQVKRDLANGHLPCHINTAALLASYIVQAEQGDRSDDCSDHSYLVGYRFISQQTDDFLHKVAQYHGTHRGMSPKEADFHLLDVARKIELYGIRLHPAKDHEDVPLSLAVCHLGILVYQHQTKINTFSWAKVRKLSFKRKKFLVKLHPEGYGYYKDCVEFYFDSRNECKNFWKKCIEHHAFFRCDEVRYQSRKRVITKGSAYRYSGRTQKQLMDFVRVNYVKRPQYERTMSTGNVPDSPPVLSVRDHDTEHPSLPRRLDENHSHSLPNRHMLHRSEVTVVYDTSGATGDKDGRPARRFLKRGASVPGVSRARGSSSPEACSLPRMTSSAREEPSQVTQTFRSGPPALDKSGRQDSNTSQRVHFSDEADNSYAVAPRSHDGHSSVDTHTPVRPSSPTSSSGSRSRRHVNLPPIPLEMGNSNVLRRDSFSLDDTVVTSPSPAFTSFTATTLRRDCSISSPPSTATSASSPRADPADSPAHSSDVNSTLPPAPYYNTRPDLVHHDSLRTETSDEVAGYRATSEFTATLSYSETRYRPAQHAVEVEPQPPVRSLQQPQVSTINVPSEERPRRYRSHHADAEERRRQRNVRVEEAQRKNDAVRFSNLDTRDSPNLATHEDACIALELDAMYINEKPSTPAEVYANGPLFRGHCLAPIVTDTDLDPPDDDDEDEDDDDDDLPPPPPAPLTSCREDQQQAPLPPPPYQTCIDEGVISPDDCLTLERPTALHNKSFFIFKELVMTERTYLTDLQLVTSTFFSYATRHACAEEPAVAALMGHLRPLNAFHCAWAALLEERFSIWIQCPQIGDLLVSLTSALHIYRNYLNHSSELVLQLADSSHVNPQLDSAVHSFEASKSAYLPLVNLLAKPAHRLYHYSTILDYYLSSLSQDAADYLEASAVLSKLKEVTNAFHAMLMHIENCVKLYKLAQDVSGVESLLDPERRFVREGCLQKLSKKGYQPRMFFLFSDQLLYTNRSSLEPLHFRVHSSISLRNLTAQDSDDLSTGPHSFVIQPANGSPLYCAASCADEKLRWLQDLNLSQADYQPLPERFSTLRSNSSNDSEDDRTAENSLERMHHRANTTVHVCWHRGLSVGALDLYRSARNQLSSYLLRKFKSTNGWQKLWVVFTNFCLFFYKSYQDLSPLASLPLLGYTISLPHPDDGIAKDHVFKLHFKTHTYFFRAENEYTFERWVEVISATTGGHR